MKDKTGLVELNLCSSEIHVHNKAKKLPQETKKFIYNLLHLNITDSKVIQQAIIQEKLTLISIKQISSLKQNYKKLLEIRTKQIQS
jgi:hypothetical protein